VSSISANEIQSDMFDDDEPLSEQELEELRESRRVPVNVSWARAGGWEMVGNGGVTNSHCATFGKFMGCLNVEGHNVVDLEGHDFRGKVVFKPVFRSCDSASCPKCYYVGWATREAGKAEARLAVSGKSWGLVEHIVVSPSPKDYALSYDVMVAKLGKYLFALGVVGGAFIFHPFRWDDAKMDWYWSPHFHVVGHVAGGYRCRGCTATVLECRACGKFEDRKYRLNEQSGWIFKVLGKRKSVFATFRYQLEHSAVKVGAKRANVVRWFGVCSYRKLKVTPVRRKHLCPLCGEEFSRIIPCFGRDEALRCEVVKFSNFSWALVDNFLGSDGCPRWFEAVGGYHD